MLNNGISQPLFRVKKKRAWELDFVRGIAVLAMCFDHLMFDLSHPWSFFSNFYDVENAFAQMLYGWSRAYWMSTTTFGFRFWAHYIFVFLFLFIVGTSCAFSRDNTRRGALCGVAALVFTGASFVCKAIGVMTYGVIFGILHCISLSILCAAALDMLTKRNKYVNMYAPLVIGAAILFVGIGMKFWTMSFDKVFTDEHFTGYVLGTYGYGDDWFGLFPYVGAVLMGMYWGKAAYPARLSLLPRLDGKWNKPFNFVGRHALIFYFLHQVVLAGIVMLVGMCMGYTM